MEKMSVQRGLMELKTLGDRIRKATNQTFMSVYIGENGKPEGFNSVQECEDTIKAKYQSVNDLIKRRSSIKAAIIKSNAETEVTIGQETMTVASAIDRKDAIIHEEALLQQLRSQYSQVVNTYNYAVQHLEQQTDKRLAEEKTDNRVLSDEDHNSIVRNTKKRYEPHFVDPLALRKEIDELTERITQFKLDVDVVLSESNAKTEIEL
ncbi:hypothetical protein EMILIAHAH_62 [Bacillus phage vB_BanH_Emiliahah]|nr:hypothetical protein EMILIAHAH_62 [Bacillus phage vB_BanH_Emiliahah]